MPSPRTRPAVAITVATLLTAAAGALTHASQAAPRVDPTPPSPSPRGEVVVLTDGVLPQARVVDPAGDRVVGTFPLAGTGTAYAGERGLAFAVQGAAGVTHAIDVRRGAPALLGSPVTGTNPVHFVAHDGLVALHHDDDGSATVVRETALRGNSPRTWTFDTGREHHGIAVPFADLVLLSVANPDDEADELPIGVEARDYRGRVLDQALDCPGLHGEAARGETVAIGCADGVLLVEVHGDHLHATKVTEPEDTAEGLRVGTVRSHEDVGYFLGNFGPESLALISPRTGTLTPVPIPGTVRSFWLHGARGGTAVVLTTDGRVHLVDPRSGEIRRFADVVPEFGTTGQRPALAIGERSAYVTDPRDGTLTEIALRGLRVTARTDVGGSPTSLAVVAR